MLQLEPHAQKDLQPNSKEPQSTIKMDGSGTEWNFVGVGDDVKSDFVYFISKSAWDTYKHNEELLKENKKDEKAIRLQEDGVGIPLLETKVLDLSITYIELYKYKIPQPGVPFNLKTDKYLFCDVKRYLHSSCDRYVLKFTPKEGDRSKDFTLKMFIHKNHPIVDVSIYNKVRYRWIRDNSSKNYKYTLHALTGDQPSLVDGMKETDEMPSSSNPLVGSRVKNFFLGKDKTSLRDLSGEVKGIFSNESHTQELPKLAKDIQSVFSTKGILEEKSPHVDSIRSVGTDTLVFLCMTCVFDRIQLDDKNDTSRKNPKSEAAMNTLATGLTNANIS